MTKKHLFLSASMNIIDRFPGIKRATLEMLYGNMSINRFRTEEEALADADSVLGAEGVYEADLEKISAWLTALSEEDLEIVVAGEEEDMKRLLSSAPPHTAGLLNDIHENAS